MIKGDTNPNSRAVISAWLIINDYVEFRTFPFEELKWCEAGPYQCDNYGMGASHWSIVSHPSEAFERQLKDNVVWAVERLPWAVENSPKEVDEIKEVIHSNGYTRLPDTLDKFRTLRSLHPKPENEEV